MSDTIEEEVTGPPQKNLTFDDFAKVVIRTEHEVWLKLLKSRFGNTARTKHEWFRAIYKLSKEPV